MANVNTRRKSGFIFRSGVRRRETQWLSLDPVSNTLAAGSTAVVSNVMSAAELALRPFTVVRTRGIFNLQSDQAGVSEFYHAGFGAAVVSDQAVAIGITAVPTPMTDRVSDLWFLFTEMMGTVQVSSAIGFQHPVGLGLEFDSKAMRKVEEGAQIIFTKETSSISLGVIAASAGRVLIKLH